NNNTGGNRILRGGLWRAGSGLLAAWSVDGLGASSQVDNLGFRVASSVNEPGTFTVFLSGLMAFSCCTRGRRKGDILSEEKGTFHACSAHELRSRLWFHGWSFSRGLPSRRRCAVVSSDGASRRTARSMKGVGASDRKRT